MPTVILLDNSLSMLRPVAAPSGDKVSETYFELAKVGLDRLLAHLEAKFKLESVGLLAFSSGYAILSPFTRDVSSVRTKLRITETADTSDLVQGLQGLALFVRDNWSGSGNDIRMDMVIVTDGGGVASDRFARDLDSVLPLGNHVGLSGFSNSSLHVCVLNKAAENLRASFSPLVEKSGLADTQVHCMTDLTRSGVEDTFQNLADAIFKPFVGTLTFGSEMTEQVSLCPPPQSPYREVRSFETIEVSISNVLDIKGFLSMADVKSPPVVSRHLVLPEVSTSDKDQPAATMEETLRLQPNLVVFLHNGLRSEALCALVQVADTPHPWFGILLSHSDKKNRACLMLALFEPGETPVPWLGNLRQLGPASELTSRDHFPVKASEGKPSYSSAPVVWIESHALIYDIQKILRQARKMPEKAMSFYKELNRLKRAALCLGFYELLDGVASIFERESVTMPPTLHPDCSRQLKHAANELRSRAAMSVDYVISPRH